MANAKIELPDPPASVPCSPMTDFGLAVCRTPVEKFVAGILSSLLHVDSVGPQDNFFLLGGHSLMGMQVIVRVREALGVELTLRTLFDHPSVAGLALEIERHLSPGA